jgi:hypothetical protein
MFGTIINICIGTVLIIASFYFKRREKKWWIYLEILAILILITNIFDLIDLL